MTPTELPRRALLLDDARPGGAALLFSAPEDWIEARTPADVPAALGRIDRAVSDGSWIAGGFAFELGYLLEPRLRPLYRQPGDPLIAVGVYRAPETVDGRAMAAASSRGPRTALGAPQAGLNFGDYARAFARVRDYIAAGDIYQVNLTMQMRASVQGSVLGLYGALRNRQPVAHGALVNLPDCPAILSRSPELFFATDAQGRIETRPMKGTAPRASNPAHDAALKLELQNSIKNRAENLMIVDLLRNDLSRVCQPGSVRVPQLYAIESYATVHQMVSQVTGEMLPGTRPSDIFAALFPCGSITGAPKIRAMEIIHELESGPRGIYCGAIGWLGPDGSAAFNVAIRTLQLAGDEARFGVGGGIVADSTPAGEYEEALWKARFAILA